MSEDPFAVNSHYVPQFILRSFGDRISCFNVRTGELAEDRDPSSVFSETECYPPELEKKLNERLECDCSRTHRKLMDSEDRIVLHRKDLLEIKRFLLMTMLRTEYHDSDLSVFRNVLLPQIREENERGSFFPFIEDERFSALSDRDYWYATLNAILDRDDIGFTEQDKEDVPFLALYWSTIIGSGQLQFWDSSGYPDKFVITDIGMASENECTTDGGQTRNVRKRGFLIDCLNTFSPSDDDERTLWNFVAQAYISQNFFRENFYMFPISSRRMIVLLNPFFERYCQMGPSVRKGLPLSEVTRFKRLDPFRPNENGYVDPSGTTGDPDDEYVYKPVKLNVKETQYCNSLFMDRIREWLGFESLRSVKGSVKAYVTNYARDLPRNDYTRLLDICRERSE